MSIGCGLGGGLDGKYVKKEPDPLLKAFETPVPRHKPQRQAHSSPSKYQKQPMLHPHDNNAHMSANPNVVYKSGMISPSLPPQTFPGSFSNHNPEQYHVLYDIGQVTSVSRSPMSRNDLPFTTGAWSYAHCRNDISHPLHHYPLSADSQSLHDSYPTQSYNTAVNYRASHNGHGMAALPHSQESYLMDMVHGNPPLLSSGCYAPHTCMHNMEYVQNPYSNGNVGQYPGSFYLPHSTPQHHHEDITDCDYENAYMYSRESQFNGAVMPPSIPLWMKVYAKASFDFDFMLQWDTFSLTELDEFQSMLKKLYRQELEYTVMKYEAFRLALLREMQLRQICMDRGTE